MLRRTIPLAIMIMSLLALMAPAGFAGTPDHANVPDGKGIPQVENCEFWRSVTTCDVTVVTGSETLVTSESCGTAGTREGTFERTHYENTVTRHKGAPNSKGKLLSSVTTTYSLDGAVAWGACVEPEPEATGGPCADGAWKTYLDASGERLYHDNNACKIAFGLK